MSAANAEPPALRAISEMLARNSFFIDAPSIKRRDHCNREGWVEAVILRPHSRFVSAGAVRLTIPSAGRGRPGRSARVSAHSAWDRTIDLFVIAITAPETVARHPGP